jgi:hypothetical protein
LIGLLFLFALVSCNRLPVIKNTATNYEINLSTRQ